MATTVSKTLSGSAVRRFALQAGVVLAVFTTVLMVGAYVRTEQLVTSDVRNEARSYLDLVVTLRTWSAGYGGVWVSKDSGARSNEYLRMLGVQPDTSTVSGRDLTLRNPALITREVSDLISTTSRVSFHLTSLNPVNPGNKPDPWEARQLEAFSRGATEAEDMLNEGDHRAYRQMRPLVTEPACLRCHAAQGYEVGDIRGALSVRIDLSKHDAELRRNAWGLGAIWLLLMSGLGVVMYGLVFRMAAAVERRQSTLTHLAATDDLTGLPNRRTTFERLEGELARGGRESRPVGIIEIDIDHFKSVNDTYGHACGDTVLVAIAQTMQRSLRAYDVVGRIGGEEFLVVAPDIDQADLMLLAQRIRENVAAQSTECEGGPIGPTTVSAGCALSLDGGETAKDLLKRADLALYAAKALGRNRVEFT